jgi:hypothetical protein
MSDEMRGKERKIRWPMRSLRAGGVMRRASKFVLSFAEHSQHLPPKKPQHIGLYCTPSLQLLHIERVDSINDLFESITNMIFIFLLKRLDVGL